MCNLPEYSITKARILSGEMNGRARIITCDPVTGFHIVLRPEQLPDGRCYCNEAVLRDYDTKRIVVCETARERFNPEERLTFKNMDMKFFKANNPDADSMIKDIKSFPASNMHNILVLKGNPGTGKTSMIERLKNWDYQRSYFASDWASLIQQFRSHAMDSAMDYIFGKDIIVIDDFSDERDPKIITEYTQSRIKWILDGIYRRGKKLIITTNKNEKYFHDHYSQQIFERLLGHTTKTITFFGDSYRMHGVVE